MSLQGFWDAIGANTSLWVQIPIAFCALCIAAASIAFAVANFRRERNARLVEVGISVLRADPEKEPDIVSARQWALDLIDANAGGVKFTLEARQALLKQALPGLLVTESPQFVIERVDREWEFIGPNHLLVKVKTKTPQRQIGKWEGEYNYSDLSSLSGVKVNFGGYEGPSLQQVIAVPNAGYSKVLCYDAEGKKSMEINAQDAGNYIIAINKGGSPISSDNGGPYILLNRQNPIIKQVQLLARIEAL